MNKTYFNENEQNDLQLLYQFNEKAKVFDEIIPTKEKAQYDAICTHKNRQFAVELKNRNLKLDSFKTIMIEDYKYLELLLVKQFEGKEPLFINFLLDDTVLIFNLDKVKNKPNFKNIPIKSNGYEKEQMERRYYLDIKDAIVYKDCKLN